MRFQKSSLAEHTQIDTDGTVEDLSVGHYDNWYGNEREGFGGMVGERGNFFRSKPSAYLIECHNRKKFKGGKSCDFNGFLSGLFGLGDLVIFDLYRVYCLYSYIFGQYRPW